MGGALRVPFHIDGAGRVRQDADVDATAWTLVGAAIAILAAIGTSFRSLRAEMRARGKDLDDLRERIDAQGAGLRERIDAQGAGLRKSDAQGADLRERIDAQGAGLSQRMEVQGAGLSQRMEAQGASLVERIDARGDGLVERIDAQGADLRKRIDAQGEQMGLLRERMAHLEGLLDGLREAITNRAA